MLKDIKHEQLVEIPMLREEILGPKEGHHMLKDITQHPQDFFLMLKEWKLKHHPQWWYI
jgi:hypothetical protein